MANIHGMAALIRVTAMKNTGFPLTGARIWWHSLRRLEISPEVAVVLDDGDMVMRWAVLL